MRRFRFEVLFAAVLLAVFSAFYVWQTPGLIQGRLTEAEIDGCVSRIDASPMLEAEVRSRIAKDLRAWALKDDGQPVYMLNLLRYYDKLHRYPGAPEMTGTPQKTNAYYEDHVMPLALKAGDFPIFAGMAQGLNLVGHEANADNWSRIIVMRYPSRRHVLALFSSPEYLPFAPYKLAALQVDLVPTSAELVLSDLRVLMGGALTILYLLVCWLRAVRRQQVPA